MASSICSKLVNLSMEGWKWWWDGLTDDKIVRVVATLAAATLAFSWYAWLIKKSAKYTPPLPPGPRGLPLLGNLPFLDSDLHRCFDKLSRIYGPIIKLRLGSRICIVISSPSLAKLALKDHDAIFANRDPPAAAVVVSYDLLDIAWSPHGPEWRKLRKVFVRELMSKTSLDACYSLRRREVLEMVKEVCGKAGSAINIREQMFLTSLNVTTSMLWGASLHGEERSKVGAQFRQVGEAIMELLGVPNVSDIFPVLAPFDLQGVKSKMKKLLGWYDRIFESLIENRMKVTEDEEGSKGSKDFLQQLLELQHGDDKSSLSMDQIKALFVDIVVGGTDSSSSTVEWAMAELLRNGEVMRKACEELDEVVGSTNIVEESHLPKLKYLDAIIKETLRLHPPVPLLVPRSPSMTCTLSGYTIPKGSKMLFNMWAIQRNPETWENPLEFQPERFLENAGKCDYQGNNFSFLPFGSGRRMCAGIPLAEKMILYVLATMLHSFRWELPKGTELDLSEKFGLVLKKREPLIAVPTAKPYTLKHYS